MPPSRGGTNAVRPVIVERKPTHAASNIAPSSPSPPSSPKAVRFAQSAALEALSRELTPPEAWSLYHFQNHARACPHCYHPLRTHLQGGRLCDNGHALAQDVALHVYYRSGDIYSTPKDDHKLVRVELPPNYDQVRDLLKGMERHLRSSARTVPIISYDRTYPVSPRRTSTEHASVDYAEARNEIIIEPADSQRHHRRSAHKSKRKSAAYQATVVQDYDSESELAQDALSRERRGSLYYSDRLRKAKEYNVEIREPESERRKRHERR